MSILEITKKINGFKSDIFKNFNNDVSIIPTMNLDDFINSPDFVKPTNTFINNNENDFIIDDFEVDTVVPDISGIVNTTLTCGKIDLNPITVTCDVVTGAIDTSTKNESEDENESDKVDDEDISYDQVTPVPEVIEFDDFEVINIGNVKEDDKTL